jgi:hypothetical protein
MNVEQVRFLITLKFVQTIRLKLNATAAARGLVHRAPVRGGPLLYGSCLVAWYQDGLAQSLNGTPLHVYTTYNEPLYTYNYNILQSLAAVSQLYAMASHARALMQRTSIPNSSPSL